MAQDDGGLDPGGQGIETRLASLEARVADLTAEIAALHASDVVRSSQRAAPSPAEIVTPAASEPARRLLVGPPPGPPPAPVGWAAYAAQAKAAPSSGTPVVWPTPAARAPESPVPTAPGPVWAPPPSGPSWSFADLEERLTGRLLAWIGGVAVLLGAVLFLSLAFSRGWIDPAGRVAIGLVGGMIVFGLGAWLFETRPLQGIVATVLVGVGLAVGTLSIVGATRLYDLVPVDLGLIGSLVLGVAAAVVAIRADSRTVGAFGLLAVLGAPPVLGAAPDAVTFALLATTLIGTTILALQRSWRWFPGLAFVLSAPQLASWLIGDAPVAPGMVALAAFWLIHAIASGGEELLRPTNRLRDSSAALLVTDAAFLVAGGFVLLDGSLEAWRGPFLVGVALAHWVLAGACLMRQGDRHPFGLLVAATGIAALTMAVPVQFHGSAVAVAWTAEGAVLAWLAAKRDHVYAGLAALVLGGLAVAHLVLVEDPIEALSSPPTATTPFLDPAGMTLAFMLGGLAVAGWFLHEPRIRVALASVALLLVTYALPFELSGLALLGGWSALAVIAVAVERFGLVSFWPGALSGPDDALGSDDALGPDDAAGPPVFTEVEHELRPGLGLIAFVPAIVALGQALTVELPVGEVGRAVLPAVPFTDQGAAAAVILVAASLLFAALRGPWSLRAGALLATAIVAYAVTFELPVEWAVVAWAGLVVAGFGAARFDPPSADMARLAGLALTALGVIVALAFISPPSRLVLSDATIDAPVWGYLAFVALAGALVFGTYSGVLKPIGPWPLIAAGGLLVYVVSVAIVDAFASRIGGSTATEELAKQAQVAVSVSWTLDGAITFAAALVRRIGPARQCGLALLALATAKVFLLDLASLDVAYRVLSLIGLGLLLLGSAYLYQRLRPGRAVSS